MRLVIKCCETILPIPEIFCFNKLVIMAKIELLRNLALSYFYSGNNVCFISRSSIHWLAIKAALPPLVLFVYTEWAYGRSITKNTKQEKFFEMKITLSTSARAAHVLSARAGSQPIYIMLCGGCGWAFLSPASLAHMSKCMCSKLFIRECRTKLDFVCSRQ